MEKPGTTPPESASSTLNDTGNVGASKGAESTGRRKIIDRRDSNAPYRKGDERRTTRDRRSQAVKQGDNDLTNQPAPGDEGFHSIPEGEEGAHQLAAMRRLLSTCERVNSASYHNLVMEGYPSNYELVQAQRLRDAFIVGGSLCLFIFIVGAGGLINAWISAMGAGLAALCFILALTPLQSLITSRPSIAELKGVQRKLVMNALSHVRFLEGAEGLAWRCAPLGEYNPHLYNSQFSKLIELSKRGALPQIMRSKNHFRLYLMFMLEAQKAYQRLQKQYLNNHFANIENNAPQNSSSA